jgi:tRNA (Thr-GGU) A37 N-methylase
MEVIYKPIGIIHSPFDSLEEMPIQPSSDESGSGIVEIFPDFVDGLKDVGGFSHIYLLYHLHRVRQAKLMPLAPPAVQIQLGCRWWNLSAWKIISSTLSE